MLSDAEIVARYLSGKFQNTIAKEDGRTQGTIRYILLRNNIKLRDSKDEWSRNGKVNGQANVISGHIQRLGKEWGIKNLKATKESCSKGGKIGGKVKSKEELERIRRLGEENVKTGWLDKIRTHEGSMKGGKTQGPIQGKRNVESGQLASLRTPEHQRTAGRAGHKKMMESRSLKDTKPEVAVKTILDTEEIRYEHPFNLNDRFWCDFYLPDYDTIVEVDGCYWHGCEECGYFKKRKRDVSRNAYIHACGYELLIIKEHELSERTSILNMLKTSDP